MKKVLITGSKGNVGQILVNGLHNFHLLPVDLPEFDLRNYDLVSKLTRDKNAIIHLAWNTKTENGNAKKWDKDNTKMWMNVYNAALKNNVPRVIMASSVHATDYESLSKQRLVSPKEELNSPKVYGRHKRFLEKQGEKFSLNGLEVICVRLGGICGIDETPWEGLKIDGLAYPDMISLFTSCLDAKIIPDNYSVIYGVSKNGESVFDLSNPFNWEPQFNSAEFYGINA